MKVVYVLAIVSLIAPGCGRRTPPESRTSVTTSDSAHAPGEPQTDSALVALGNEPFWNVRVTSDEILYRDPEHQEGYRFPPVAAVEEGGARVFSTRRDIPAGAPGPRVLELRIRQGTCSDGMSDRQYPMTAELRIHDQTYTGCAWYQPEPRPAAPRPPATK